MEETQFGRRLAQVRRERNITSEKLAALCDVSTVFVRQIEHGNRNPSITMLVRMCNVLHVSPNFLLSGELEPNELDTYNEVSNRLRDLSPKQLSMLSDIISVMINHMAQ